MKNISNYLLAENNTNDEIHISNQSYNKYNINNKGEPEILKKKTNNTDGLERINDFILILIIVVILL